ncbi:hypothetical protein FQN55_003822 [Onygenales sp. PD_40]|nr:hypothetical protein FQN55_003822 [Onygenales sp. PD_40]
MSQRPLSAFLGFSKSYNTALFCIFAFPFFLFSLWQAIDCLVSNGLRNGNIIPGEMYWFRQGRGRLGIFIHLATVLPFSMLSVPQFSPALRRKWPAFHRINGRISLVLFFVSSIGALMIADISFGGAFDIQVMVVILTAVSTISAALAYYNAYRLQLDAHRAWILRTMFYSGVILTARPVILLSAVFISKLGTYQNIWPCEMIDWTWKAYGAGDYLPSYPECASPNATTTIVTADLFSEYDPAARGASFQIPGSASFMLALIWHAVGVEIYLARTQNEANRLRIQSERRQRAAGYANLGSVDKIAGMEPQTDPKLEDSSKEAGAGGEDEGVRRRARLAGRETGTVE